MFGTKNRPLRAIFFALPLLAYMVIFIYLAITGSFSAISDQIGWASTACIILLMSLGFAGPFRLSPMYDLFFGIYRHGLPHPFWPAVLTMLPTLIMFTAFLAYEFTQDVRNYAPPAIALAASFASLGWYLQAHNSKSLQIKSHTLQSIQGFRSGPVFKWHETNLYTRYPPGQNVEISELANLVAEKRVPGNFSLPGSASGERAPVISSINFILNHYESMALGIRLGDLDEKMMRNFYTGIALASYRKFIHVIFDDCAEKEGFNKIWEHYRWLMCLWYGDKIQIQNWSPEVWVDIPDVKSLETIRAERHGAGLGN